jgi:hypothetical protein
LRKTPVKTILPFKPGKAALAGEGCSHRAELNRRRLEEGMIQRERMIKYGTWAFRTSL